MVLPNQKLVFYYRCQVENKQRFARLWDMKLYMKQVEFLRRLMRNYYKFICMLWEKYIALWQEW